MKNRFNNGDFVYNGIDRIDSSHGYTKDNIVTCCKICNKMKMDMSLDNFIEQIYKIKEHYINTSV